MLEGLLGILDFQSTGTYQSCNVWMETRLVVELPLQNFILQHSDPHVQFFIFILQPRYGLLYIYERRWK